MIFYFSSTRLLSSSYIKKAVSAKRLRFSLKKLRCAPNYFCFCLSDQTKFVRLNFFSFLLFIFII